MQKAVNYRLNWSNHWRPWLSVKKRQQAFGKTKTLDNQNGKLWRNSSLRETIDQLTQDKAEAKEESITKKVAEEEAIKGRERIEMDREDNLEAKVEDNLTEVLKDLNKGMNLWIYFKELRLMSLRYSWHNKVRRYSKRLKGIKTSNSKLD